MLKRIECVKVYWNDGMTRPSFYPDEKSAAAAVERACNADGRHRPALGVAFQKSVKYLNMECESDRRWYESHLGRTFKEKRGPGRPKAQSEAPAVRALSESESHDPARQAAGRAGGLANAGLRHLYLGRRPKGSVGFKDMTVKEKRAYWRWADARRRARREQAA